MRLVLCLLPISCFYCLTIIIEFGKESNRIHRVPILHCIVDLSPCNHYFIFLQVVICRLVAHDFLDIHLVLKLCISMYPFPSPSSDLLPLWDGLESRVGSKTRRQTCRDLEYATVSWYSLMSQVQVPWNAQSCAKCHPSNISNPQADPQRKKFWDTSLINETIKIPACVTPHKLALPACKRASVIISSTALPIQYQD